MDAKNIALLRAYLEKRIQENGCDHTHRFSQEWARIASIDSPDLLDILEAHGAYCDCEALLNMPEAIKTNQSPESAQRVDNNPWLLPLAFQCEESSVFTKVIVCRANLGRNTYAAEGELLFPAPKHAKPRRRVRKSVNFFIGCQSGLPAEIGVVQECEPISALEYIRQISKLGLGELSLVSFREAAFVLSRIAALKLSTPVGTHYSERVGITSRYEELEVHRIFVRP